MPTTLGSLATRVHGQIQGRDASGADAAETLIAGANPLADAESGDITLVDAAERLADLAQTPAAAVVLPAKLAGESTPVPAILVEDVHAAFATIVRSFLPEEPEVRWGVHPSAAVDAGACVAADASVGPGASVGEGAQIEAGAVIHAGAHIGPRCFVGRGAVVHAAAVLYADTRIGERTIVHSGAVLGAHGFGFEQRDGRHVPCAQLGFVVVGDDVEVGAGSTIDRGTYGATRIGDGTKIDNLVQIAHNCRIGRHNLICSQVGIAGSTVTEDYVVMAGQVGVRDHVRIGAGAVLSAMAGITHDVPAGEVMMGIPATPQREQKLKQAALAKLPEMRKEFKAVRRELERVAKLLAAVSGEDASVERAA